ncbi:Hypothetical predicted protein, partial [Olea europaea subsp. europaea]
MRASGRPNEPGPSRAGPSSAETSQMSRAVKLHARRTTKSDPGPAPSADLPPPALSRARSPKLRAQSSKLEPRASDRGEARPGQARPGG